MSIWREVYLISVDWFGLSRATAIIGLSSDSATNANSVFNSQRLAESDPRTTVDAAAFAAILDGLGRYGESEAIYRRALAVFEESFGPVHYEVAATLHNLAAVLVTKRNYQEAEENYRRALSIKERLLGADSTDVALTCSNLGSLLTVLGRRSESVPLLKSAIAILETRLTPAHPQLVLARENLRKALS